jgi:hypothetical protein
MGRLQQLHIPQQISRFKLLVRTLLELNSRGLEPHPALKGSF